VEWGGGALGPGVNDCAARSVCSGAAGGNGGAIATGGSGSATPASSGEKQSPVELE